jgi:2,3-bisphosphoglycerate-dependent phosphoglycerate mutase
VDVDLTPEGEAQARRAGELLKAEHVDFDRAFTSVLTRAIRTCGLALLTAGQSDVAVTQDWRLNERHYGGLTGLDKAETAERHGADQVKVWRRSYDIPPPDMAADSPWSFDDDPRYAGLPIPRTESLKTTLERVLPCWEGEIAPLLKGGETILVAAHGNSLRAIVKLLFGVGEAEIVHVEIPTGNPLLIELDGGPKPLSARYLDEARAQPLPAIA